MSHHLCNVNCATIKFMVELFMPIYTKKADKWICNVEVDKEVALCQKLQIMHSYFKNHLDKRREIQ